jgi:Mg/Co/Ni transporter MgtE
MGFFRSDNDRAAAGAAKALLDKMPDKVRREILRSLSDTDAQTVREATQAIEREQAARRAAADHTAQDRSGWWTNPR